MKNHIRPFVFIVTLVLVLLVSAVAPISALADGETPPPTETSVGEVSTPTAETPVATETPATPETPVVTETVVPSETPVEESVIEETTTVVPSETPVEESVVEETVTEVLSQAPEGTELVLLAEQGEVVPLVSAEAEEILSFGDPIWCPATVAVPQPGVGGCTDPAGGANYDPTKLSSLINYLMILDPAVNGVIWIEKSFDSSVQDAVASWVLSGASFTNMDLFTLTIRGGWNGLGTGTIDTADRSELNGRLTITGWQNTITLSDLLITGTSGGAALNINTTKDINLLRVNVENNAGDGIFLDNQTGTGKISIINSSSKQNAGTVGLRAYSSGPITLNTVTVMQNTSTGMAADLDNSFSSAAIPPGVTINNSQFNLNAGSYGLRVISKGAITLNTVNVNQNSSSFAGAYLDNGPGTGKVTITNSAFNQNGGLYSLYINSKNLVTLNGVNVNSNTSSNTAARIYNTASTVSAGVTIASSHFDTNGGNYGLLVGSLGAITLNGVIASGNTNGQGAWVDNSGATLAKSVTIIGLSAFNNNKYSGLQVTSKGAILVTDLTASGNGNTGLSGYGAQLDNDLGNAAPVTLSGTNVFNDNYGTGLLIYSMGAVKINNIVANGNDGTGNGVYVDNWNAITPQPVTFTGSNQAKNNKYTNVYILSRGLVTLNSVDASGSISGDGIHIDNCQWNGSDCVGSGGVTLTGTNTSSYNNGHGIYIVSAGLIKLNSMSANWNNGYGAILDNCQSTGVNICWGSKAVSLTGTNTFNENLGSGLVITTKGSITVSNLTANGNNTYGALWENDFVGSLGTVLLTGFNFFNENQFDGLYIESLRSVTLYNITANDNIGGQGIFVDTCRWDAGVCRGNGNISLLGTNAMNDNSANGLALFAGGAVTANNVSTISNNAYGAYIENCHLSAGTCTVKKDVIFKGYGKFSENGNMGLYVNSGGNIRATNLTVDANNYWGANLYNNYIGSTGGIAITGVNSFSNNARVGLSAISSGAISLSSVTAINNGFGGGGGGLELDNSSGIAKPVTLGGLKNIISYNQASNLYVSSAGVITVNSLTADGAANVGGVGLYTTYNSPAYYSVVINGTNSFSDNAGTGIYIESSGMVKANNIVASLNNNQGMSITNLASGDLFPRNVLLTGTNTFYGNQATGLQIQSYGSITVSNVHAILNGQAGYGFGADLTNNAGSISRPIAITGANQFNQNYSGGLFVVSLGPVSGSYITANDNGVASGSGAYISNTGGTGGVTLTGSNTFNGNQFAGLGVSSYGAITINNLTANYNQNSYGAALDNSASTLLVAPGVTLTGTNTFNYNETEGLYVASLGKIAANNLTAIGTVSGDGVFLDGYFPSAVGDVIVTGIGTFTDNYVHGLYIRAKGAIKVMTTKITSTGNGLTGLWGIGLYLANQDSVTPKDVALTGTNLLSGNYSNGLYIQTLGKISLNNITANDTVDGTGATIYGNAGGAIGTVIMTGTNAFNSNNNTGLVVNTAGAVTMNNITASFNGQPSGSGVSINNTAGGIPQPVKLTGTNTFEGNGSTGIGISSLGQISINNLTASHSVTGNGAYLENSGGGAVGGVTLTGYATFVENALLGLSISSLGNVSMVKVTADGNGQDGVNIITPGNITLTCGSFTHNGGNGLDLDSAATITLTGVFASGNTLANIEPTGMTGTVNYIRTCPLP